MQVFYGSFIERKYAWITHVVDDRWPWPQSATFCLHSCAMFMKIHSYITNNLELEYYRREVDKFVGDSKKDSDKEASAKIDALKSELKKGNTQFPNNVSLYNFWDYLLIPTLVYELEYPRTDTIRLSYIVEKIVACLGIVVTLYFMVEHYIYPSLQQLQQQTVVETVLQLLIPFTVGWLMIFYIIFECVCNAFAEFTRFADRDFYEDWWNSSSYDEFARKWNKPVHEFLLR